MNFLNSFFFVIFEYFYNIILSSNGQTNEFDLLAVAYLVAPFDDVIHNRPNIPYAGLWDISVAEDEKKLLRNYISITVVEIAEKLGRHTLFASQVGATIS